MNPHPIPPPGEVSTGQQYRKGRHCLNCGAYNEDGAAYCHQCGKSTVNARAKTLIFLLIFLGLPGLVVGGCGLIVGLSALVGPKTPPADSQMVNYVGFFPAAIGIPLFLFLLYQLISTLRQRPPQTDHANQPPKEKP